MKYSRSFRGGSAFLAGALVVACGARTGLPVGEGSSEGDGKLGCKGSPIGVTAPIPNLYLFSTLPRA